MPEQWMHGEDERLLGDVDAAMNVVEVFVCGWAWTCIRQLQAETPWRTRKGQKQ